MKLIKFILILCFFVSHITFANPPPDKVVLVLDWFLNPDHAPIFVAQQQGFFKKQHLDVEWVTPADPSDPPKLIAAKKADIAITYQYALMIDIAQGLPLMRLGTLVNSPLNCLVVDAKGPIKSIADLKNKTIATSTPVDPGLSGMLSHHHLSLRDVNPINVHYDLTQALLSKKIDAAVSMLRNFEVIQLQLAGFEPRVFLPEKNGVPNYDEFIFITHQARSHDATLIRFVKAIKEATEYLKHHPEEMWQAFAKYSPENNNELNHRAWFATLPYFASDPAKLDRQKYEKYVLFLKQQNTIQKIPSLSFLTIRHLIADMCFIPFFNL